MNTSTVETCIALKDGSTMPLSFDVVPQITGKLARTNSKILNRYKLKDNWTLKMKNLADSSREEDDAESC